MKKFTVIVFILVGILGVAIYGIAQRKIAISDQLINNMDYDNLYDKTISGSELASFINKTMDKNKNNDVEINEKNYYIDNGKNSIIIEVHFKESTDTFRMEQIYSKGIKQFVYLYSNKKFKCSKLEYHKDSKLVKYLYFEEV